MAKLWLTRRGSGFRSWLGRPEVYLPPSGERMIVLLQDPYTREVQKKAIYYDKTKRANFWEKPPFLQATN